MITQVQYKNVLFAFSDPAGAKAILAFVYLNRQHMKNFTVVSDRVYDFYSMFGVKVQDWRQHSTSEWVSLTKPDVIITGTSSPEKIELNFIREAAKANIPSASFIDHWFNLAMRFRPANEMILPDAVFVIDEQAKQTAISEGLPESRLQACGNPYYDFLKQWKPEMSRQSLLQHIGLTTEERYLLYAPEPLSVFGLDKKYGFNEAEGLDDLEKATADMDIRLVVKLHPNQQPAVFDKFRTHVSIRFAENENINNLIYYAEAVVGFFSNSLIESLQLGKPVIRNLSRLSNPRLDPLAGHSGFITCHTQSALYNSINVVYDQIH